MNQSQEILQILKACLRANNLTYDDIAEKLDLSVASIKRIFSGRSPLSLERLEMVCELMNLDVWQLVSMSRSAIANEKIDTFTKEQELEIAADSKLFTFFYCLVKNLKLKYIMNYYNFTKAECTKFYLHLDRLKLIEYHSDDKVKLLISPMIKWLPGGPLTTMYKQEMKEEFLDSEFDRKNDFFQFTTGHMSEQSRKRINEKFEKILAEIKQITEIDSNLGLQKSSTVTILVGCRSWMPSVMKGHRKKASGKDITPTFSGG